MLGNNSISGTKREESKTKNVENRSMGVGGVGMAWLGYCNASTRLIAGGFRGH